LPEEVFAGAVKFPGWSEWQKGSALGKSGSVIRKGMPLLLGVAKKLAGRHHHSQSIRHVKAKSQLKYKH